MCLKDERNILWVEFEMEAVIRMVLSIERLERKGGELEDGQKASEAIMVMEFGSDIKHGVGKTEGGNE